MISIIETLYKILLDKSKSIGYRTSVFISLIGLIVLFDLCFHFSYDIYISNKLSNLETINNLKEVYGKDQDKLFFLNSTEKKIFENKHYSEFLMFKNYDLKVRKDEVKTPATIEKTPNVKEETRSLKWMFISSNFFLIVAFIILFIVGFFMKKEEKKYMFIGFFAMFIIALGVMSLLTWSLYLIPVIMNKPYLNYILNFIIQTLIVVLPLQLLIHRNKKSNTVTWD